MANKVYNSAGVYTHEKDLTFTTETIGVTTLGAVGETKKGPAFQPMFIKNYDEFKTTFGGTSPEKFKNTQIVKYELPYIAKSYLTQSNQLYVTRVLGLSGYNGGQSYAIRTIGSCDQETMTNTTGDTTTINFEVTITGATPGVFTTNGGAVELIDQISTVTGIAATKFDTGYYQFFNILNYATSDWYLNNAMYWGIFGSTEQTAVSAARNTKNLTTGSSVTPTYTDAYELPLNIAVSDRTNQILLNEFTYDENTDEFTGYAFALYTYDIEATSPSTITGKTDVTLYTFTASPNAEYHKKLVASLKSRGSYSSNVLTFNVDPLTVNTSQITSAESNPFATFDITGNTVGGASFNYSVSLDKTQKNYIKNVLGVSASDKDTHLFVEEVYDSSLKKGWYFGKVKGLHYDIVPIETWSHYKFQFQSPATPYFVSELRGGVPEKLFRCISISDGTNANTETKMSIGNVNLDKKIFDLYVRAYGDSDKNPVYLEKYLSVSMDDTQDNYIGRRVGTIDNTYPLKSSYIIMDMAENAPKDAVPSGFEGYEFRSYGTGITESTYVGVPEISYKTRYYAAGDLIVNPPFATPIYSNGDKVRKAFLGFSDLDYGYDTDLTYFKGKVSLDDSNTYNEGSDWSTKTKGFHLDVNAGTIVNDAGDTVFAVGIGSFTDSTAIAADTSHPYYDIKTRKFTALFAGGFDGWDIYRSQRTNTDTYKIGRTGFTQAGFDTFTSVEYDETLGTSDYYASLLGIKTFENPERTIINILVTPGLDIVNNTELIKDTVEIVEEKRMDSIYLPTLPDIKMIDNASATNTDDWLYPSNILDELVNTEIDSNYTAVYYPYIQISDNENNANVFIPPTAEVVKNLAFTDNIAFPWFATAGYERGIVNCIRTRIQLDQESRDILDPGRINPLATFADVGVVIWGNRNLQIKDSAANKLNIRRLLLQARRLIISVSNRLLFDPNDGQIRSQFLSAVNPILENIRKERGLTDFRVALSSDNIDSDRDTLTGKIFLKPTPSLEVIELEFTVTPTSVSFDNLS